jgi:hypothetical protein
MKNRFHPILSIVFLLLAFSHHGYSQAAAKTAPGVDIREKISSQIVTGLAAKDYKAVRKDFAKTMLDALSENKIKNDWEALLIKIGSFQKVLSSQEETSKGYNIVKKRCQFSEQNASVQVTFNDENKVIGLYFKL